jgi:outer membrane protein assembly factor BamE (lipoprotein component of BamABCDE complex)
VKTRERERSRKRETKSLLDSKKQKKAKILFKKNKKFRSFDQKIQKNSKRIFFTTDREKTTKKLEEEVRWEGTRHITLLCY